MKKYVYDVKRIIKRRIDYAKKGGEEQLLNKYNNSVFSAYIHFFRDIEGMTEKSSSIKAEELMNVLNNNEKFVIPRLVVNITDRCTLQCKECSALIPYFKKRSEAEYDLLIQDIDKILNIVDEIICLEFIGGEPLLYSKLEALLQYTQKISKIKMVEITTNATIVPNEELIQVLKNEKTLVQISEYKNIDKQKIGEVQKILEENSIKYKVLEMDRWYSYGNADKRMRSKRELLYSYYYCNDNESCRTLYDGKIFVCGRAAALYGIGKLTDNSSFLEVRQNDKITNENIKDFYLHKKYAEACDFCDVSRDVLKVVEVAEQC